MIPASRAVRIAALLTLLITVGLGLETGARAAEGDADVYTILGVDVDATAKTAAAAREIALAQGHLAAFRRLMLRLVLRNNLGDLPTLDAEGVASLLRSFEVDSEKTSRVRYLATLRFRFEAAAVQDFLRNAGSPFAETRSKRILVLPVYRSGGISMLWETANPWRRAWVALPPADGLVPMTVPAGELADINDIGPEQASRGDEERIGAITSRYGTDEAVLAEAQRGRHRGRNVPALQVTVTRFGTVGDDRTVVRSFVARSGETAGALIARAAAATAAQVEEVWKTDNLLRFDQQSEIVVVVPLDRLADLVAMERRLTKIAFIRSRELVALSRGEAVIRLLYLGELDQLAVALAQRDVELVKGPVSWELHMADAASRRPEAER